MAYSGDRLKAKKIHEKAHHYRGRFLTIVAEIERELAIILTEFFCVDEDETKNIFFNSIMIKIVGFNGKIKLLREICKRYYPLYWQENKQYFDEMKNIQELRNSLAHSTIDISREALDRPIDDGVSFIQWKDGKLLTDEIFDDLKVKASMIITCLHEIKRLLPFKQVVDQNE